jgi:uncharacterized protein (TIGR02646 family)
MQSVKKNRGEPPAVLLSEKTQGTINDLMRRRVLLGHPKMDILLDEELLHRLEDIFSGKCAYCERLISVRNSTLLVGHYRPYTLYYWLAYEWTNLIPLCEDCFTFRDNTFPVAHDENRIIAPPSKREHWTAEYAQIEVPLVLNPELDTPDLFFYFNREGNILPYNQQIRALTTIKVFNLNQGYSVIGRREKIREFTHIFHTKLQDFLLQFPDGKHDKNQAQEFFGNAISLLTLSAQQECEYSALGKDMIKNFGYFFIDNLDSELKREALESAFYSCLSLKANSAAKKIVMQTDDKPLEQFYAFESITVKNIKCFDEVKIGYIEPENRSVLLLVGGNGSGKSTILQLIALALAGVHKPPADYGWEDVIKKHDVAAEFSIKTKKNGGEETSMMLFEVDNYDIIHCRSHKEFYDSVRRNTLVLAYGTGRNHGQNDGLRYKNFEGIASLFGEDRFMKSLFEESVQHVISEKFDLFKTLINKIFSKIYEYEDLRLESYSSRDFYFKSSTGGLSTLNSLSDGFQTIFSWFFDMLIRMEEDGNDISAPEKIRAIVLIDEIDMHLNLQLQKTFLPAIEEIFPNVQFIITTQSPFTIQSMNSNNVLILENQEGHIAANPFFASGKPWAWSLTDILSRMVGHSVELSPKLDLKLTEYRKAKNSDNTALAEKIYKELSEAIPENSPLLPYLNSL